MATPSGWQPLSTPKRRAGAEAFQTSPFTKLARAHLFTAMGDALVTLALAGSLFFELDPNDARWKVFLYLALTMAPLALIAPFLGPALDRSHGGRRWMIVAVNAARAAVCLVMVDDLDGLLLFPEAFAVLAFGKAYGVARSAFVPTVVHSDSELVRANSKLQLLSGLAAPVAVVPAGIAYAIAGSEGVMAVAVVAYAVAAVASLRIPATQVAAGPATAAETAELRGAGVVLAASAMGLVRGIVGFLAFLLLFHLRSEPTWQLAVVLVVTAAGVLGGAVLAPVLRRSMSEERMILGSLCLTVAVAAVAAWTGGLAAGAAMAATVAVVSTAAKLAFDSIVQRDAPDANRGRSFARFEVRFQIVWVVGAVIAVVIPIPIQIGFLAIGCVAAFAAFSYLAGQRAARRGDVADERSASPHADPTSVRTKRFDPTTVRPVGLDPTVVEGGGTDPTPSSWPPGSRP